MRVAVEEAVDEKLVEHHRRELGGHLDRVDAGRAQRFDVGDLDRRHILHRQHPARRALPDELGDAHSRVTREVLGEPLGIGRLSEIVNLLQAGQRKLLHEAWHVDPIRDETHPTENPGDPTQGPQVDIDDQLNTWTLDLQDDVGQSGLGGINRCQSRSMDLAEGCRGKWNRIHEGESAIETHTQLGFGVGANLLERDCGDLILQALEFLRDFGRQDVES